MLWIVDNTLFAQHNGYVMPRGFVHHGPQVADDSGVIQWMTSGCPLRTKGLSLGVPPAVCTGDSRESASAGLQFLDQISDLFEDDFSFAELTLDLLDCVDDRGVISSPEQSGDAGVAEIGLITEHVHRNLTRGDKWALAALTFERLDFEAEDLRDLVE